MSTVKLSPEIEFNDGLIDNHWKVYKFNFNGASTPKIEEVNKVKGIFVKFSLVDHFFVYGFANSYESDTLETEIISEECILANFSTTNSAHSICELMSFLNYYKEFGDNKPVLLTDICLKRLPFVSQLLTNIVGKDNINVISSDKVYYLENCIIRRNAHFAYIENWNQIKYEHEDNVLVFENLQDTLNHYNIDTNIIRDAVKSIYQEYKDRYITYDKIMFAKLSSDKNMTTPGRALIIGQDLKERIETAGIKLLSLDDFENIEQYVTTLYSAKLFITSYGGAACTNRFFLNDCSQVILIGNKQYAWEYEYPSDYGEQWHLRHSHLFPVSKQTVILYHNDEVTADDADRLIELSKNVD